MGEMRAMSAELDIKEEVKEYDFKGRHYYSLDTKSRTFMPSRFREDLGDKFVLSIGFDGCLTALPQEVWKKFAKDLLSKSEYDEEARYLRREFTSNAEDCVVDKQGRILIPGELKEAANIKKDIVMTGNIDKVEIWDLETWNEYRRQKSLKAAGQNV